ncbi:bifunctional diaminohydroxyphosphoribosylaminopyrimidine deaminase/5-amino-6-(5-phosphoribosylamino)uracil reductase RibD [Chryseobacterium sp. A301]
MSDKAYMTRCLELAQKALGDTYPNPIVGAVITHNDKIIGEGFHQKAGSPHAEINAISQIEDHSILKESTLYVSLEPCSHFGLTPPCALRVKELGFKRVVIGVLDPSEKVDGKGVKLLKEAGIEVCVGVLEEKARELNKRFITSQIKKRPYITLKWAQSADGFLDQDFKPTSISNPKLNQWVHLLRHQEHSILVGTRTAQRDKPSLTVRHIEGRNPIRIVLDLDLKLSTDTPLFNLEAPTLVFNSKKQQVEGNIEYMKIDSTNLIPNLLTELHLRGIQSVLVEGGAQMHRQFLELGLWDTAYQIQNPELFLEKGTLAPTINSLATQKWTIGNNLLTEYKNDYSFFNSSSS